MEKAIKSGEEISSEFRLKHKNGYYLNVASRGKLIKRGSKHKLIAVIRDITSQKKADIMLKKSEQKFREAYNRANFYKDLFAHDMSNILQNIYSAFQLSLMQLKEGKEIKDIYENTDIIINQVNRGAKLIANVRKLSELEDSGLQLQSIDALNILNKCIKFVIETFQNREINIRIESHKEKIIVNGNNLLEDVFENILINAIKHNQNSPIDIMIKVTIIQKEGIDYVKFEFEDNGIGILDVNKELIFQRGIITEKTVSGMGIGLSLVKKILDIYNGQIWVEDKIQGEYSKGSNFIVLIPEVK
jgi:signal transduction histidine kinase